ncbi:class I SAM-dependent methyltransferase [Streptomyces scopuliridis]|uniref:Methyltransferase n=1 Tax=Streptomyces scopuliridis RB72 TaxID=1440053 RepID=A0A2T7TF04_9ACTN|nr:class I SAM-dependent methyltransferase [Streptomyces scopuliridis]PVE13712.1 methyltransferase [Streptomyces scopuliridis RB72]
MQPIANTQQADAWNGHEGAHWANNPDRYDSLNGGFNDALFEAAAIGERDRVLDIGCGTGQTTRLAARRAALGQAVGIDISVPMVERARAIAAEEGIANAVFEQGDAQVHSFPSGHYHAAVSRGGVMFFADHIAAFTNIGGALRPGGRLTFICPQLPSPEADSARIFAPVNALIRQPSPAQRGMVSLSDPARIHEVLTTAGFTEVTVTSVEGSVDWGRTADEAVDFYFAMGPVRFNLDGVHEEVVGDARERVREALRPYETPDGVRLRGAVWLATATRP